MIHNRFVDQGITITHFSIDIWVLCPKCDEVLRMQSTSGFSWHQNKMIKFTGPQFACSNCQLKFAKVFDEQHCISCQKPLFHRQGAEKYQAYNMIECRSCHTKNDMQMMRQTLAQRNDREGGFDTFYGLELVLKLTVGKHTLWFYNLAHAEYVESYVKATIRERSAAAGNNSLISRLPAWLKSAKNRSVILKAIEQIKIKATW